MTVNLLTAATLWALPRSMEKMSNVPKKQFEVKMMLNKVDLGENIDVELSYSSEECASYRNIVAKMHNSKEKKLDESFFQSIGLSGQIFVPFMRIYERTRQYSVNMVIDILKAKKVNFPLEKMEQEKQRQIKTFIASEEVTDKQLDQFNNQELGMYRFLKDVYGEYIHSGNKVLTQEFHFKRMTGFIQNIAHNSCKTNDIIRLSALSFKTLPENRR